jgi:hypothetical protein
MPGTSIENEVEIYATNLTNKTMCVSTNAQKKLENFVKTCSAYSQRHLWSKT